MIEAMTKAMTEEMTKAMNDEMETMKTTSESVTDDSLSVVDGRLCVWRRSSD